MNNKQTNEKLNSRVLHRITKFSKYNNPPILMCFEAEAAMCLSVSTEHTFPRKQPSPKAGDYGVIQFVKLALRQTPPSPPPSLPRPP